MKSIIILSSLYLADEGVCVVEVSSIEPWSVSPAVLHLDTDLLPALSHTNNLVVHLNATYNTYVRKLHSQQKSAVIKAKSQG